ncbi:FAST kinase domain-containing protein 4, partial [Pseudolycoriella hygida]
MRFKDPVITLSRKWSRHNTVVDLRLINRLKQRYSVIRSLTLQPVEGYVNGSVFFRQKNNLIFQMFNIHRLVTRTLGPSVCRTNFSTSTNTKTITASDKKPDNAKESEMSERRPVKNPMIASAFNSLLQTQMNEPETSKVDSVDERIVTANSVLALLSVAESQPVLTRQQALKIVSILAEWSSINRAKLSEFENDARFIKLCRQIGRPVPKVNAATQANARKISGFRTDDLNMVMGIAGDDEAAKLIASISVSQMVKVMSSLASKGRRSTPLLRSLAYNISNNSEPLDLKQCADVLYAMAVLNFSDSVLITRIGMDIQKGVADNMDKPAVIRSIVTSLGLLRFRDNALLETLTDWMIKHKENCRPKDALSLLFSLASLNYPTEKAEILKTDLVTTFSAADFSKVAEWVNYVWALVVLDFAEASHIESVLGSEFIQKLVTENQGTLTPRLKMKLLNINAAAKNSNQKYSGPLLAEQSEIFDVLLEHSKNKIFLVDGLSDAVKALFSSAELIRKHHDTRMGFVI